jgi:hypothetical protein
MHRIRTRILTGVVLMLLFCFPGQSLHEGVACPTVLGRAVRQRRAHLGSPAAIVADLRGDRQEG